MGYGFIACSKDQRYSSSIHSIDIVVTHPICLLKYFLPLLSLTSVIDLWPYVLAFDEEETGNVHSDMILF